MGALSGFTQKGCLYFLLFVDDDAFGETCCYEKAGDILVFTDKPGKSSEHFSISVEWN